jgi:HSP20 family protein
MSLREAMDRLFEERFIEPTRLWLWPQMEMGNLPLDVYQTDDHVTVKASLPGVSPDEVEISITGDLLTIKGEHKEETEAKEEDYFRKERRFGAFSRSVTMPVPVQGDKADASFQDGVLTVNVPKAEEARPKQIKVKPKAQIEGEKK